MPRAGFWLALMFLVACAAGTRVPLTRPDPADPRSPMAPVASLSSMDTDHVAAPVSTEPVAPYGYTCPMHRNVRADAPGQCPRCHMNLVPAKEPAK